VDVQTKMVRQVSRTFALSIEQLPPGLRNPVGVAYLLLRVSDILEDHPGLPTGRKAELLRLWAQVLEGSAAVQELTSQVADLDRSDPEVAVAQQADLVMSMVHRQPPQVQDILVSYVHQSTLGMARWQEHGPFVEDEAALDDYMHEVAGRVGYLVTDLFLWYYPDLQPRRDELMPLARECGLALQTVNVIRGLPKDYARGWVFVPITFYQRFGLTRDTLFEPANLPQAMRVVSMLADKADRHLGHGLAYVTAFPRRYHGLRLALMWPFYFAVRTLAINRQDPGVIQGEAKMTRPEVQRIVVQTKLLGWSNWWLYRYYDKLSQARSSSQRPDGSEPRHAYGT
jgi:farnesyl-diphosphate farnesyltransferase